MLYNQEVEQQLIGALLINDIAYDDVAYVKPEYFSVPLHQRMFAHIKELKGQGKAVTPQYLNQFFSNDNDLPNKSYVSDLVDAVMTTQYTKVHASQLHAMYLRRELKELGGHLINLSQNPSMDETPKDILAAAEQFIQDATDTGDDVTLRHISVQLEQAINNVRTSPMGIRSGISQLDELLRGYQPGKLYIIGARPAMGKTAMGLTHAINASIQGVKTLFFSLEMTHEEIQKRLVLRFQDHKEIRDANLFVDDKSGLSVADITQRARRHKRKNGLDIIFIDYLGLIRAVDKRAQMVHQIGEITSTLKGLAKDLKVPVVLLCQLNRAVEKQDNKRPTMADLRDSGAIEQDADVCMFIYREEYYLQNEKPASGKYQRGENVDKLAALQHAKGKAEIIVAKNRHGKVGTINLNFDAGRQVFFD